MENQRTENGIDEFKKMWWLSFKRDEPFFRIHGNDPEELAKIRRAMDAKKTPGWEEEPIPEAEGGEGPWEWALRGPKKKVSLRPSARLKRKGEVPWAKMFALDWLEGEGSEGFNQEGVFATIPGNRSSGQRTLVKGMLRSPYCRIATNDNTVITKIRNLCAQNPMSAGNPLGWAAVRRSGKEGGPKADYVVAYCPKGCVGFRS